MPFKSDKQRRYLWANEPEIARRWTKEHGSRIQKDDGGIMRLPFANGLDTTRLLNKYLKDYPLKDVLNLDPSILKTFEQDPRLQKDPELAQRQKGRWGYTYAGRTLDPRDKELMDFYLGMGINPSDPNLYIRDLARFGEETQNPNYRKHQDDLNRRIAEVAAHEGRHRLLKKNPQFEESISAEQPWGEFDKHERFNLMLDYLAGSENLGERMDDYSDLNTAGWSSLHPDVRRNYDELYKTAQAFNKGMLSNYERTGGISNLTDPDLNKYINKSPEIFTPQGDEIFTPQGDEDEDNVPLRFRDAKTLADYFNPRQRALRQSNRYWNRGDARTGPQKWMGNIMSGIRTLGQGVSNFAGNLRQGHTTQAGYNAARNSRIAQNRVLMRSNPRSIENLRINYARMGLNKDQIKQKVQNFQNVTNQISNQNAGNQQTSGDHHSGNQSTVDGQTTDWGDMSYMIAGGGLAQRAPRGSYFNGGLASIWPR